MMEFGVARITPGDIFRLARAKANGLRFFSLSDLIRSKKRRRLEAEPVVRVSVDEEGIHLWPHRGFWDPAMLRAIEETFNQFDFALHRHGPRPLTKREFRRLRKTYSERFLAQAMPEGTTWLEVPLEVRFGSNLDENDDLRAGLAAGREWKSLKEIRDIVSLVRMRHLPPGMSGYEYFM
jgi:hypothetical protein